MFKFKVIIIVNVYIKIKQQYKQNKYKQAVR